MLKFLKCRSKVIVKVRKSKLFTKNIYVKYQIPTSTVNVVIFTGGKFRENVGKTFHVGVIFTIFHLFPS